ncbi:hypothetical protein ACFP3T_13570 [Lactiplantibacillus dongliensis]|uniref:Phage protein n=1 Tax=Lactiplantibacillus dongliensis TaxID=2559919 RepID=A0ABW1R729_9LACO|nr:hypothetical protein [Lactiplantibacillus dongliensis]
MTKEIFENIKLLEEAATELLQLVTTIADVREELSSTLPNGKLVKIPTLLVSLESQLMSIANKLDDYADYLTTESLPTKNNTKG